MSFAKVLFTASIAILVYTGCEKEEQAEKEAEITVEKKVESNTVETDGDELFDEFYDSTSAKKDFTKIDTVQNIEKNVQNSQDDSKTKSDELEFDNDGRYVVQISCIASDAIAEDVAKKIERKGYPVYIAEVTNPTPQLLGKYYRIRIGGFESTTKASFFGENYLLPEGYDFWVDNRSNDHIGIGDFGLGDDAFMEEEPVEVYDTTTSSSEEPKAAIKENVPNEVFDRLYPANFTIIASLIHILSQLSIFSLLSR